MINILDKQVSDMIAAGEVVERPVSIVKELVENSIDAGSKTITIEIKDGGKSYIRVTDDGTGITRDDLKKAFLRHATSKVKEKMDLDRITTLGFRGEALASIAAVSRIEAFTMTSVETTGSKIMISGGDTISISEVGCPVGTTMIIYDLFFNTPARLNFLKSSQAEAGMIINTVSRLAISNPKIKFKLISSDKVIFTTSGTGEIQRTINEVFTNKDFHDLLKVDYSNDNIHVYGVVSKPELNRNTRRDEFFMVNKRIIKSKILEKALETGYKERLFQGRYPVAFLYMEVDPAYIDVNIHPTKSEVRFDDDRVITNVVTEAVRRTITTSDSMTEFKVSERKSDLFSFYKNKTDADSDLGEKSSHECNAYNPQTFKPSENNQIIDDDIKNFLSKKREIIDSFQEEDERDTETAMDDDINILEIEKENHPFEFSELQFKTIIFDTYILCSDKDAFYMIDQHAAHERINYEKFVSAYNSSEKKSQLIITPLLIDVSPEASSLESFWKKNIENLGYSIELFGNATYKIDEIPEFMNMHEAEVFASEFIESYASEYEANQETDNRVVIDKLITKSCKKAVKAGDVLKEEETESLLDTLKKCVNPYSCPHGRPTFVRFSKYEIEKLFKRVQ